MPGTYQARLENAKETRKLPESDSKLQGPLQPPSHFIYYFGLVLSLRETQSFIPQVPVASLIYTAAGVFLFTFLTQLDASLSLLFIPRLLFIRRSFRYLAGNSRRLWFRWVTLRYFRSRKSRYPGKEIHLEDLSYRILPF